MLKRLALFVAFLIALPNSGMAQDTLEGYVPPPMFGAPRPIPPKKNVPKTPKMPRLSTPVEVEPKTVKPYKAKIINTKPASKTLPPKEDKKTIIPLKKPEHPKENFNGKPLGQVPEKGSVERNKITPWLEPIDLLKRQQKTKRAPSKGIVKGPKTMPSNKKKAVDSEVLFEPKNLTPVTLIDKAQKKAEEEIAPPAPIENQNFNLPSFKTLSDGKRKLNLVFPETQDGLKGEQLYTIDKLIIPHLKDNEKSRLQLISYASQQENSISGDRRIALSRAMAVRNHIVKKGISPSRIDVRSLGTQTDIQPIDRIEIFLVN